MGLLARVFEACSRVLLIGRSHGDVTQHVHHHNSLTVNTIAKHISQEYLSYENCPATSYVAATFHPTIGQRAP